MAIVSQAITGQEKTSDDISPYYALVDFYRAFNKQNVELMEANWLQTEDASMSNPLGGIKRGWNEIKEIYKKIFSGPASVYVEFYDYTIYATENMFVAVGRERGSLIINNKTIDLAIRTSRTYCLNDNKWRQVHHHGSMDNPELLETYQTILLNK